MKRTFIFMLFFLLIFSSLCYGQSNLNSVLISKKLFDENNSNLKNQPPSFLFNIKSEAVTKIDSMNVYYAWYEPILSKPIKYLYEYDVHNNITYEIISVWNSIGQKFVISSRFILQVDKYGRTILKRSEDYIDSTNTWQVQWNYEFSYNDAGDYKSELFEYYDNGVLVEGTRYIIEYGPLGYLIRSETYVDGSWFLSFQRKLEKFFEDNKEIHESYTFENGDWSNSSRISYTFDEAKRKTEYFHEIWEGNWEARLRETFAYNEDNKLEFRIVEEWEEGVLKYKNKNEYYWNSIEKQDSMIISKWNENSSWIQSNKYFYKYDNSGNQIFELSQYWAGSWINSWKEVREYNSFNKLIYREDFPWDSNNENWENRSKFIYETDEYGNHILGQHFWWEDGEFIIRDGKMWLGYNDVDSAIYYNAAKIELFYNTLWVGVDDDKKIKNNYKLEQNYPNPFNPKTTIEFSIPNVEMHGNVSLQLKIYDVIGNEIAVLVDEQKPAGNYEATFDASILSSGVYYYQLVAGDFIKTKKMILLK